MYFITQTEIIIHYFLDRIDCFILIFNVQKHPTSGFEFQAIATDGAPSRLRRMKMVVAGIQMALEVQINE